MSFCLFYSLLRMRWVLLWINARRCCDSTILTSGTQFVDEDNHNRGLALLGVTDGVELKVGRIALLLRLHYMDYEG